MSVLHVSRLSLLAAFASLTLALTGCALNGGPAMLPGTGSTTIGVGTPRTSLGGKVYGGQQAITGATVSSVGGRHECYVWHRRNVARDHHDGRKWKLQLQ